MLLLGHDVIPVIATGVARAAEVWCAGNGGVHHVSSQGLRSVPPPSGVGHPTALHVSDLLTDVWLGWSSGHISVCGTDGTSHSPGQQPHINTVTAIQTLADSSLRQSEPRVITASQDGIVIEWDAATQVVLRAFPRHTSGVQCAAAWGSVLLTAAGADICLWEGASAELISKRAGHPDDHITCLATHVGPNADRAAVWCGTATGRAVVWALSSTTLLHRGPAGPAPLVCLKSRGDVVCSVDAGGCCAVYSATTLRRLRTIAALEGDFLAAALVDGSLWLTLAKGGITCTRLPDLDGISAQHSTPWGTPCCASPTEAQSASRNRIATASASPSEGSPGECTPPHDASPPPPAAPVAAVAASLPPVAVAVSAAPVVEAGAEVEAERRKGRDLWQEVEALQGSLEQERREHGRLNELLDERHARIVSLTQAQGDMQAEVCHKDLLLKEKVRLERIASEELRAAAERGDAEAERAASLAAELEAERAERSQLRQQMGDRLLHEQQAHSEATEALEVRHMQEAQALEAQLQAADTRCAALPRLEARCTGLEAELEGKAQALQAAVASHEEAVAAVKAEAQRHAQEAAEQLGSLQAVVAQREGDAVLLQRMCDTQAEKLRLLEEQLADAHASSSSASEKAAKEGIAEMQLSVMRAELDASKKRERDRAAQLDGVKRRVAELEAAGPDPAMLEANASLQQQLDAAQKEAAMHADILQSDLAEARRKEVELVREVCSLMQQVDDLQEKEKEITEGPAAITEAQVALLRADAEEERRRASALHEQLRQRGQQLEDAQRYTAVITDELESPQSRIDAADGRHAAALAQKEQQLQRVQRRLEESVEIVAEAQHVAEVQGLRAAELEKHVGEDKACRMEVEKELTQAKVKTDGLLQEVALLQGQVRSSAAESSAHEQRERAAVAKLESELADAHREGEDLRDRMRNQAADTVREQRDTLMQSERKTGNLLVQITTLQRDLDAAREAENALRIQKESARDVEEKLHKAEEAARLNEDAADRCIAVEREYSQLRVTAVQAQADLASTRSELESLEKQAAADLQRLRDTTTENETLRQGLAEARSSRALLEEAHREKEAEVAQMRAAVDAAVRRGEQETHALKSELSAKQEVAVLRQKLADAEEALCYPAPAQGDAAEAGRLRERVAKLEASLASARDEAQRQHRRDRSKEKQAIRELHDEAVRLAAESQTLTARIRQTEEEKAAVEAQHAAAEGLLAVARDECSRLRAEMYQLELDTPLPTPDALVVGTQTDPPVESSALADAMQEVASLRKQHASVRKQARENEQRVATIASELAESLAAREEATRELDVAQSQLRYVSCAHGDVTPCLPHSRVRESSAQALQEKEEALSSVRSCLDERTAQLVAKNHDPVSATASVSSQPELSATGDSASEVNTLYHTLREEHVALQAAYTATLQDLDEARLERDLRSATEPTELQERIAAAEEQLLVQAAATDHERMQLRNELLSLKEELRQERARRTEVEQVIASQGTPSLRSCSRSGQEEGGPHFPERVVVMHVSSAALRYCCGMYIWNGDYSHGNPVYTSDNKVLTQGPRGCKITRHGVKQGVIAKGLSLAALASGQGGGSPVRLEAPGGGDTTATSRTAWTEIGTAVQVSIDLQWCGVLASRSGSGDSRPSLK